MYKALDVAKYAINYSNVIESPVSNLKLQKLLYYGQAATLVEKGSKCFEEPIIAWEYGPVIIDVYQIYREFGRNNIPNQKESKEMIFDFSKMKIVFNRSKEIIESDKKIIDKIVKAYSSIKNPFELVKKTHQEEPWIKTRLNEEIDCNLIMKYYKRNPGKLYG